MRSLLLPLLLVQAFTANAQHLTYTEWLHRAMADIRLLPRYGDREKNDAQRASDAEFIAATLVVDSLPRSASGRLVQHGIQLLTEGDLTKAMYRFNQAWLVDSTNADAYWGYGSFFMELDRPAVALSWYRRGFAMDSTSTRLLTGMATALLAEEHPVRPQDSERADDLLSAAMALLQRAHQLDPTDQGTLYRLAVCHLKRNECAEAHRYFDAIEKKDAPPVEAGFARRLAVGCPR
ncbi:MAG: tetratricopeptide repeat protein [Flavobacteriales bacterium]|nr:tetratricopeptide repeat protein [Flavobacteriales bacterium]